MAWLAEYAEDIPVVRSEYQAQRVSQLNLAVVRQEFG